MSGAGKGDDSWSAAGQAGLVPGWRVSCCDDRARAAHPADPLQSPAPVWPEVAMAPASGQVDFPASGGSVQRATTQVCGRPQLPDLLAALAPADTCVGGGCGPTAWGTLWRPGTFPATAASSLGSCPLLTSWSQNKCWRVPRAIWGDDQELTQRLTRNLEWLVPWTWPHRVPSAQKELERHMLATWQNVPEDTPSRLPPSSSHAHLPPPLLSP